jgi:DNA-binding transcriptional LysR family regulator
VTLRQLELLRAVLLRRSLSGAASELGISQPAVSQQMKALARELGTPLFVTRARGLEPTAAARTLGGYAERILRLVAEGDQATRLAARERALLTVVASSTPGVHLLPRRITAYRRLEPGCFPSLEVLNTEEVEARVAAGEADVGVVGGRLRGSRLLAEPWLEDEIVLVVAPDHRLARRRRIAAGDLADETLLTREPGSATRATVEAEFLRAGIPLPRGEIVGGTDAIKAAVAADLGVAFVSRYAVEVERRAGALAVLRLRGIPLRRPLQILRSPSRSSPLAEAFVDFLLSGRPT